MPSEPGSLEAFIAAHLVDQAVLDVVFDMVRTVKTAESPLDALAAPPPPALRRGSSSRRRSREEALLALDDDDDDPTMIFASPRPMASTPTPAARQTSRVGCIQKRACTP
mmetsp:Transcript_10442/g.42244  ORF Transcript_10442/g.42244 Transcript_10442/m.42244 type:complete len:110 (-) Transcript_10442:457-786(-)